MAVARLLLFGAALLALVVPGHPLALLRGLPLDLLALSLALLVVGWAIALPGAPPRARALAAALLLVAALKLTVWSLAPSYGLVGEYRVEGQPGTVRVDEELDFQGDTFPVHFFNDVRRFNYYTPNEPRRDLLPFSARWSGQLVVPADGEYTLSVEANGPATLEVGDDRRVAVDQAGRVREAALTIPLRAGLAPVAVTYTRPPETMPWLVVRLGAPGGEAIVLGGQNVVRAGTPPEAVARDAWLRPLAFALDGLLVLLLGLGFFGHAWSARRHSGSAGIPSLRSGQALAAPVGRSLGGRDDRTFSGERILLAIYVVAVGGAALLGHLHLFGRAVILSGGNDWLAYESFARDILQNGPLLTEGRALGQGVPFYYQPLYIYWVALTHLILGESLFAPLFMNAVLGIATGVGLYVLTRSLFGRAAAVVGLAVFEVARQSVFAPTAGLLLSENLVFPLVPVVLLILARLAANGRLGTAAGAGFVLGLAGLARTTPLALLPPALLILLLAWKRVSLGRFGVGPDRLGMGWGGVAARLGVIVLACTLTLGLATARNYVVSGRLVPITSSAGANLWEAHRPSSKVDLSRIDRDPLYERLGLDRQTREVVEFARQDPAGYVGTLVPMFLFAVGVVGAIEGRWDVHPLLVGLCLTYLASTLLVRRARTLPTWFLHAFVWSHLAQMTVFFSHQYGFRLILPMYVAIVPIVALGLVALADRLLALIGPRVPRPAASQKAVKAPEGSGQPSPAARVVLVVVALVGGAAGLGAGDWRGQDAVRQAFYGLNGDAAIAARQALRPDLLRRADGTYFVGDDSRSADVAYLSGLAFPMLRWFDGARGLVLPPVGEEALYVVPDRAAADLAKRCLGEAASLGRGRDPVTGADLELLMASAGAGDCAALREPIGARLAETVEPTVRLLGIDGPASLEPGRALDVLIHWETLGRPRNRARPFVRLVDSRGRRWGQAECAVYPSSSWRTGERAIGLARLDVDPTLPPGEYRLEGGFSAGSGQARLTEDGSWGSTGLPVARGATVRLVSRSTPLPADGLQLDRRLDAALDGGRLIGVDLDREAARAGERLRVSLFWERAGAVAQPREVSIVARRGGRVIQEWRGVPVDGTYPTTAWKPGEIVRDTWDLTLPAALSAGEVELAAGLAASGQLATQYAPIGTVAVQTADIQRTEPDLRARLDVRFAGGPTLVGIDHRGRRARAGDQVDLTLVWRTDQPIPGDRMVAVALLDEAGRIVAQQESEPAGGKRPTSGWTADEFIEDGWKVRLPRDLPRGRTRLAVSLVDTVANRRVLTAAGTAWVELPIEVGSE